MKKEIILPKVPSKLITIALRDLEKAEKIRSYKIDMDTWHEANGKCSVCMAGSVMAFSLDADKSESLSPFNFSSNRWQLHAINALREGEVNEAFRLLKQGLPREVLKSVGKYVDVVDYENNKTQFKKDMRSLARKLKAVGH